MAALYGDYAKQTGQTAGRTSLRVGLRQCAHTMNRVTELHATGFDCIDSVGHLPYFRLLRGFHLAHGIINHIIGSILLRILQTGNADSAILYLNLVQIDASRSLHQLRQGLRRDVFQSSDRVPDRGNITTRLRQTRGNRPYR